MKFIAFIIALNIVSLIVAPVIAIAFPNGDCENECCIMSDNQEQKTANNCCNTVCNPFEVCSCCVNGEIKKLEYSFILNHSKIVNVIATEKNYSSTYLSDCWQPPETI
jgi:hypothetical protein